MREAANLPREREQLVKGFAYLLGFTNPKYSREVSRSIWMSIHRSNGGLQSKASCRSHKPARLFPLNRHMHPPHTRTD